MALRATSGPALSTRSVAVGQVVAATAKVENTAAGEARVTLFAEGTPHPIVFDPPAAGVPGKSRRALAFSWTASLPEGKDALTLRGKLVLRETDTGRLVGEAPLDLYVAVPAGPEGRGQPR